MKYLLMLTIFITAFATVNAQTSGGTSGSAQKKILPPKKATARQLRGTGQYYGSKDTTPGSPMGTGGAGGDMSGSPAGSALETDDKATNAQARKDSAVSSQTTNAQAQTDSAVSSHTTVTKKATIRKKRISHSKTRSSL